MAAMDHDPFQTDPVLKRAAGYPYDITPTSYTFIDGEAAPFDPALTKGRYPVIGYGSNQSPQRLRQKYGAAHAPIAVQRGRLADHDVVYSAHFSSYGSLPAALRHVEGNALGEVYAYLSFRGHVARDEQPIALAEVAAENRRHGALRQIDALTLMRDRLSPGTALADFVHGHISDAKLRATRVRQLMAAAVDVQHAAHEVVRRGLE